MGAAHCAIYTISCVQSCLLSRYRVVLKAKWVTIKYLKWNTKAEVWLGLGRETLEEKGPKSALSVFELDTDDHKKVAAAEVVVQRIKSELWALLHSVLQLS